MNDFEYIEGTDPFDNLIFQAEKQLSIIQKELDYYRLQYEMVLNNKDAWTKYMISLKECQANKPMVNGNETSLNPIIASTAENEMQLFP
tara:strand:- start:371 stop:637 length:267 start_codon:yes stop_codon:yes gene_type:complete